jgi:uncharacterized SAM-binding protein YcdF (DUF218 family)
MRRSPSTVPSGRSGWRRLLLLAVAVLISVVFLQWQAVLSFLGGGLIASESPQPADLILVLGGDFWGPRVIKGAELGRGGYAPLVLISSPPYYDRPEGELAVDFLVKRGYPKEMFAVFPHTAESTIAEAIVLGHELARRQAKQVLLVTSSYHSRRAAIVFRLFCRGVHFISVPALDPNYDPPGWWKQRTSRDLFFSEWIKIIGTVTIAYPIYVVSRWKSQLWDGRANLLSRI